MSLTAILIVTLGTLATLLGQELPGIKRNSAVSRAISPSACDGTKPIVCNSCNAISLCIGTTQTAIVSCPSATPYCNYGTTSDFCSATAMPTVCDTTPQATTFTCTSTGVFPDPTNCRIYHVCLTSEGASDVYTCPTGYIFNLSTNLCIRPASTVQCTTVSCTAGVPGFVRYGTSQLYYAFCDGGNPPNTYMFKCPNRAVFTFTTGTNFGECVYSCPGQGNFINTNNPASYFQCYIDNGRLIYALVACPSGRTFNQTLRYCT